MRLLRLIVGMLGCALALAAQAPADLTLTLAATNGKTRFWMGEPIRLDVAFRATTPERYEFRRPPYTSGYTFAAAPADGVVNLLQIYPQVGAFGGAMPQPVLLKAEPIGHTVELNDWLAFRKPGKYRISLEAKTVTPAGTRLDQLTSKAIPLRSNIVEIELVDNPAWSRSELEVHVAAVKSWQPLPQQSSRGGGPLGGGISGQYIVQGFNGAHYLSLLDTAESAIALVSLYVNRYSGEMDRQLNNGLLRSPHRALIIAEMEKVLQDPDVPVRGPFIDLLYDLAARSRTSPADFAKAAEEYYVKLAAAFPRKRGAARTESLVTLTDLRLPNRMPPTVLDIVYKNLAEIPASRLEFLFRSNWGYYGSPGIVPYLPAIAAKPGPAGDAALKRLLEVNPPEGVRIVLDRLRNLSERTVPADLLLRLPEAELPALDESFAIALDRGRPVEAQLARYASAAIYPRVRVMYERLPFYSKCNELLAYFLRVDPAYGATQLARVRANGEKCPLKFSDLLMSSGMEEAAIQDLAASDASVREAAAALLRDAGSPGAKVALIGAIERLKGNSVVTLIHAVLSGRNWEIATADLDRMRPSCPDDVCRNMVGSIPARETRISYMDGEEAYGFQLGRLRNLTLKQLENSARSYPAGTEFSFNQKRSALPWSMQNHLDNARRVFEAAGLRIAPD